MDDQDLTERLRDLFRQNDTTNFNVMDFIHAEGSPLLALLYARLLWPKFVEIDEMIFLKETFEDDSDRARLQDAFAAMGGDRTAVERSFNRYEIEDLFGRRIRETTEEVDYFLLEVLQETWTARLNNVYPHRQFRVLIVQPDETGGNAALVFFQQRSIRSDS